MTSSVRKRQHRVALGLKVKDGDVSVGPVGGGGVGGVWEEVEVGMFSNLT